MAKKRSTQFSALPFSSSTEVESASEAFEIFYESFCKEIDQQLTMRLKCDGKCFLGSNKEKPRCHMYWQEISQKKFRPLLKRNVQLTDGFRLCSYDLAQVRQFYEK